MNHSSPVSALLPNNTSWYGTESIVSTGHLNPHVFAKLRAASFLRRLRPVFDQRTSNLSNSSSATVSNGTPPSFAHSGPDEETRRLSLLESILDPSLEWPAGCFQITQNGSNFLLVTTASAGVFRTWLLARRMLLPTAPSSSLRGTKPGDRGCGSP